MFLFLMEKKIILDKVNLKIDKNSIFGISGHTGSGKSTLLDIISNLKKPLEGQVLVDGKYDLNSDKYDYRQLVSYVPPEIIFS